VPLQKKLKIYIIDWFRLKYSPLLNVAIGLLFVDIMVDPTNLIFHSKYVLFGLVFLIWLIKIIRTKTNIIAPPPLFLILAFIGIFMPFYALSVGIINGVITNSDIETFAYFNSFFFFLLLLVIVNENIELTKYINYSSLVVVALTLGLYFVLLFDPKFFIDVYHYIVLEKGAVVYAIRNYGDFTLLMMFYKTSPILVFPLSYYLYRLFINTNKRRLIPDSIFLFLFIVTLFLSGSRANVLALLVIILFYLGFYVFKKSKKGFVLVGILSLIVFVLVIPAFFDLLLNQNETSNLVKYGHFSSYLEFFESHKIMAIFGQGIGGSFFSTGMNMVSNVSELTYLEIIRIWGFPMALVFFGVLILPFILEIRSGKIGPVFIAYIAYLFIAGTNPLLLSSTGMIVLVYVFSEAYKKYYKPSENNVTRNNNFIP